MAEKMAALGRLMASLAHELNNPLQGVQNCLHLAARSDLPESQRQEFILMARQEVERVSALAQTAMEYYRPRRLIRQSVELIGLLETVLNLVEPQLRNNHITVRREFPAQPIHIEVIRDNIQQVILNLLLNAMDALAALPGERTIWIEVLEGDKLFSGKIEGLVVLPGAKQAFAVVDCDSCDVPSDLLELELSGFN